MSRISPPINVKEEDGCNQAPNDVNQVVRLNVHRCAAQEEVERQHRIE